jgi:hypothetical protein
MLVLIFVANLLLYLVYKLNFIIDMYVYIEKNCLFKVLYYLWFQIVHIPLI